MINIMINIGSKRFVPSVLVEKDGLKKVNLTLEPKIPQNTLKHVTLTRQIKGKSRVGEGERVGEEKN